MNKNTIKSDYLLSINKQFKYYKMLGDKTFEQLDNNELFIALKPSSNSIALIVKHMHGNMKSRWTDFLTSDGEKEWRNRDQEFELDYNSREIMLEKWEEGWACLFQAVADIETVELAHIVYIRNIGHTVLEAINRQLGHYAYHVGQIVFIGNAIKGKEWKSLSIPKGYSEKYNALKFSKEKQRGHFSDEFLTKE